MALQCIMDKISKEYFRYWRCVDDFHVGISGIEGQSRTNEP